MSCQHSDVCMCAEVFYSFHLHLNPVHVCVMFGRKVYYSFIYVLFFVFVLLLLLLNFILIHQMHRHCCLLEVGGSPHLSLNDEY